MPKYMFHFLGLIDYTNNMVVLSPYNLAILLSIQFIGVKCVTDEEFQVNDLFQIII